MRKLSLAALLAGLSLPAYAEDLAVLVGVERYQELRRLSGGDDIVGGAMALRNGDYDVTVLRNGNARDTMRALDGLADRAHDAGRLVVGLSGRFVTDGNRSWLLAADAETPTLFGLDHAISVETVMQVLAAAPGQAILVLGYDLSDDRAQGRHLRNGLGALTVPQGVTVIYGEPDDVDNLVPDAIAAPGANVLAYVRNDRRLTAAGYQPDVLVMQPAEPEQERPRVDPSLRAFNDAQEANTPEAFRAFLRAYPRSIYAGEARALLNGLEADPVRLAELDESALELSRAARREVQRDLTLLGFDTRGVDGIFGGGTRSAIRNWQGENGFARTSFLTAEQVSRIDAQARLRAAELSAEQERERAETLRQDRAYWEQTGANGDARGYRDYLDRYPEGIYAQEAQSKLDELNSAPSLEDARQREDALNVNPILRRLIEARLAASGLNPGAIDGRFDNSTRAALRIYQEQAGLAGTGYLDQATLARLLADTISR